VADIGGLHVLGTERMNRAASTPVARAVARARAIRFNRTSSFRSKDDLMRLSAATAS